LDLTVIPYRLSGRFRQIAYLGIVSVAALGAALFAWGFGPWAAAPGCFLAYLLAYGLHEHILWKVWRRWHGVPDLSGCWRCGENCLTIQQTWTRVGIVGTVAGKPVNSWLAGWDGQTGVFQVLLHVPECPWLLVEIRQSSADALTIRNLLADRLAEDWHRDLSQP
jgi:hypothetical protein